jgi:O-antigen ligase
MWAFAERAVMQHPLRGVGAGGYKKWTLEEIHRHDPTITDAPIHSHCHSAPLQVAATTGLIGLALAGGVVIRALRGGFSELGPPGERTGLGSYAAGPAFAILGLMLAGLFDPVQINTQTGALLMTLMGMCLVSRPSKEEPAPGSENPR